MRGSIVVDHAASTVQSSFEATTKRIGPTKAEWELHRSQITRLYLDESLKLKDVMDILKENGFNATARMYKDRMKKWGLVKNIKEHEVVAILKTISERDADGKKTTIQKHNQVVEIERCLRHARRKGMQTVAQSSADVPTYISCTTPPPQPMSRSDDNQANLITDPYDPSQHFSATSISLFWTPNSLENHEEDVGELDSDWSGAVTPLFDEEIARINRDDAFHYYFDHQNIYRSPSLPKVLSVPEQLFYNIRTYYAGSFENGDWVQRNKDGFTLTSLSDLIDPDPRNEFLGYCYMAVDLRNRGLLVEFRRVLSKAFGTVQNIIQSNHPRTLDRFFEALLYLIHKGLVKVVIVLHNYIRDLATNFTSSENPWGRVFRLISTLDEASLVETIAKSWQCNNDALGNDLGQFSNLSLLATLNRIQNVYETTDPLQEERILRRLLEDCVKLSNKSSTQVPIIMFTLGQSMLVQGRYSEAEILGLNILSRARNEPQINLNARVDALVLAAKGQYCQNKRNAAEKNMRDAISLLVNEWGKIGPLSIQYMNTLEGWLREWRRDKEANELKVAINLVIGLDETDLE